MAPAAKDCSHDGCCKQEHGDNLGEYVQLAIFDIQATRPDLINEFGDVLDDENFLNQVAQRIEKRFGLCAKGPSLVDDELAIKQTNDYSEQFDLILSSGKVNVFGGYMTTCRPARF